jgi:transcription initiation factor TFIIIB Brf1 subunit/transcription initiation factor TFIIB
MKCPNCHSRHVGLNDSGENWAEFECAQCGTLWFEDNDDYLQ